LTDDEEGEEEMDGSGGGSGSGCISPIAHFWSSLIIVRCNEAGALERERVRKRHGSNFFLIKARGDVSSAVFLFFFDVMGNDARMWLCRTH
jgi:hypothetical protein